MSKSAYETIGTYTIYAIHSVDDMECDVVFVGRTRSSDLRRVLRYHRDGRKKITAEDFSKSATAIKPTIHTLCVLNNCSASLAYRYNLAWYRHFDENGYITLASAEFDEAAYTMLPETLEIYQKISKIKIAPLLEKNYIPPKKRKNDRKYESKSDENKKTMTQLNLKVDESEREAFSELCQSNNLTQREAFGVLLANSSKSVSTKIIKEQSKILKEQLDVIKKLQGMSRGAKADIRLKQAISFTKTAINQYLDLLFENREIDDPLLKCITWNSFSKVFPNRETYDYPYEDCIFLMKLESICYGKGRYPAVFLWGEDIETGCRRKLRYYPKREYVGISLTKNPYLYKGMLLLVGCRKASDDAVDILIALPVMHNSSQIWSRAMENQEKEKRSLDEIIQNSQV